MELAFHSPEKCGNVGAITLDLHNKLGKLMKESNVFIIRVRVIKTTTTPVHPHSSQIDDNVIFNHSRRNRSYQQRNKYGAKFSEPAAHCSGTKHEIMAKASFIFGNTLYDHPHHNH